MNSFAFVVVLFLWCLHDSFQTPAGWTSQERSITNEGKEFDIKETVQLSQEDSSSTSPFTSPKSIQAVTLLKQTISPLQLDVEERLKKVKEMEELELNPVLIDISNTRLTLANITNEISNLQHRDNVEYPLQVERLRKYKEQIISSNFENERAINALMTEGTEQLNHIQNKIRERKEDVQILSELQKWIVSQIALGKDGSQDFVHISSALTKLSSEFPSLAPFLLQLQQEQEGKNEKRRLSPETVKEMVSDLLTQTNSQIKELETNQTQLTLSLAQEKSHLESKMAENDVNYKQTINQINQLHDQEKLIKESIVNLQIKQSEVESQLTKLNQSKDEIELSWNYEKQQLAEIQISINSVLQMIETLSQ
eukprot:c17444_g1_i1.p1 GENE.c17444_g1_i1~~c17444_g1_i1.p1  ORF type:complete len:367 (-),score=157.17 c17444_g1_i1:3-1103(-)